MAHTRARLQPVDRDAGSHVIETRAGMGERSRRIGGVDVRRLHGKRSEHGFEGVQLPIRERIGRLVGDGEVGEHSRQP